MTHPLDRAMEAFWAPEFGDDTLTSRRRMAAALHTLIPMNPMKKPATEWGSDLKSAATRIGPLLAAAYAAGWWLGHAIHRANDRLASRRVALAPVATPEVTDCEVELSAPSVRVPY